MAALATNATSDLTPAVAAAGGSGFARLSRDSIVFALGSVSGKIIGVALLPILTRLMTPEQYGRFDLLSTLGSAGVSVLLLGMNVAATRATLDPQRPDHERRSIVGSWLVLQFAVVLPPAALLIVAGPVISTTLFGPSAPPGGVQIVALILVAGVIQYLALTVLRVLQRAVGFTILSFATLGLNALLAVILLSAWVRDERAPLLAYGMSLVVGAALGLAMIGRVWFTRPTLGGARTLLVLGLPLMPAIAATWIAEFANRGVLIGAAGAAELGYFSVALRFASVAGLVVAGFQLAWQPRAFALGTSPSALAKTAADASRILVVVCASVVLIAAASPELVSVVSGPAFGPSLPALGLSLCGVLGTAAYVVTSMPSALGNRFRDLGLSGAIGVAAGLGMNLVLATEFGSAGTALAIALGQALAAVLAWRLGHGSVAMPLRWARTGAVVLLAAVTSIASTLPDGGAPLPLRVLLLTAFAGVIWQEGSLRESLDWARGRFR